MTVKSSISLTDEQHTIARALVEAGHYASLNAILLGQRVDDAEELETVALRKLLSRRRAGTFVKAEQLDGLLARMIAEKRCAQGLV